MMRHRTGKRKIDKKFINKLGHNSNLKRRKGIDKGFYAFSLSISILNIFHIYSELEFLE